jgi:hypothetical protein
MRRRAIFPAVVIGLVGPAVRAESVDFQLVSQSVQVDMPSRTATFSITFNRAPDFAADPDSQQVNGFQYEVDAAWRGEEAPMDFDHISTVLRGSELFEGKGLPIRDRDGTTDDFSGGWGPVRDFVPVTVEGDTVSFTTKLADLGDNDGVFRYHVFATDRGLLTSESTGATSAAASIPLPPAVLSGITVLGGAVLIPRFRRLRLRGSSR